MMCKWRSPTIRKGPVSRSSAGPRVVLCNWRGRRALLGGSETRFTSCSALPCLASRHREHNVAPHRAPEPHPDPRSVRGPHTHFNLQPPPGVGDGEYCLRPPAPQQPFQTAPLRHPSLPAWVFPQLCRPVFCLISSIMSVHPVRPSASRGSWPSSRPLSLQFGAYLVKS